MILAGALAGLFVGGLVLDQTLDTESTLSASGPAPASAPQLQVQFDEDPAEEELPPWLEDFSANMTYSTDYVWRGISQTDEEFAVAGGIEYADESGVEVGAWSSSVDFAAAEVDLWVGYTLEEIIPDLDLTGRLMQYVYPGDSEFDFLEFQVEADWQDFVTGLFAYTDDLAGSDEPAYYFAGGVSHEVVEDIDVHALVGFYQSDAFADDNYTHYELGASTGVGPWELDLRLHGTDNADDTFGDASDTRVVLGLTASF